MATDDIKDQFQKNSEKSFPKKQNIFGPITRGKLKAQVALHVNWLRVRRAGSLVAKYIKTVDLKATNAERIDLEAVIYVSVASIVAHTAHAGQLLKTEKKPYIRHPEHVAARLHDPYEKQIALLHDVLENSNLTAEFLIELGFEPDVVADVALLTHKDKKTVPYLDYIRNLSTSLRAGRIKIEDIKHNTLKGRIIDFSGRYDVALSYLQAFQGGKIAPGSSIMDYLTKEPYEFILGNKPIEQWTQEEVTAKAEQLYKVRNIMLEKSGEKTEIGKWDSLIAKLVRERRIPAPHPPQGDNDNNPGQPELKAS
ncbi:MAG: hypothetical protein DYH13_04410 [Alphaproteobacteria bacterium PRO2]|nr:hypothetical protein [Alphaproteobacteria bacterium PRO2]